MIYSIDKLISNTIEGDSMRDGLYLNDCRTNRFVKPSILWGIFMRDWQAALVLDEKEALRTE